MKKPVVKLNPQEADGVTRRGRGTRDKHKFKVGQVVMLLTCDGPTAVPVMVTLDEGQKVRVHYGQFQFDMERNQLRSLTKLERGRKS